MRKLLILFIFVSFNTFSAECVIQGLIVSKRGSDQYIDNSTIKKRIDFAKWEDCYVRAIEIAETRVFNQKGMKPYFALDMKNEWEWRNLEVSQTIIFKWKFDDAFFRDSSGFVSKYSPKENPMLGDNAINVNGYYIKE